MCVCPCTCAMYVAVYVCLRVHVGAAHVCVSVGVTCRGVWNGGMHVEVCVLWGVCMWLLCVHVCVHVCVEHVHTSVYVEVCVVGVCVHV